MNITTILNRYCFILALVLCTSCSSSKKITEETNFNETKIEKEYSLKKIDFYIARGQLLKSEFEHFSLDERTLVAQCGELKKTDSSNPEKIINENKIIELNISQLDEIERLTNLLKEKHLSNTSVYPPAEAAHSANTGGIAKLVMKIGMEEYTIQSSFDAIVDEQILSLETSKELLINLRDITKELCGNTKFFGI